MQPQPWLRSSDESQPAPLPKVLTVGELARRSGVSRLGAAFLGARGADPGLAQRRQPAALRARDACAGWRSSRSRRRSASRSPRSARGSTRCPGGKAGLGEARRRLARRSRPADRPADPAPRPARRLHRLRLPLGRRLPPAQPGGPGRGSGAGAAPPDRRLGRHRAAVPDRPRASPASSSANSRQGASASRPAL